MKYTVAQLEAIRDAASSIVGRLDDEIAVQYRLEKVNPTNEWGASEREVDLGQDFEYEHIRELMKSLMRLEVMNQITGADRFKELYARELEEKQAAYIAKFTGAGIDEYTEEDEVTDAANWPNLNGDNEPGY